MTRKLDGGFTRNDDTGKLRYDLIPKEMLDELAELYRDGAKVHGENNWKQSTEEKDFIPSAWRHFMDLVDGKNKARAPLIFNINGIVNARKGRNQTR